MTTDPTSRKTSGGRKPRQNKWASPLARQAHSNARRKLAREAAAREDAALNKARSEINMAERRLATVEINRRRNSLVSGLTPRLRAVMQSWGLNLITSIQPGSSVGGWTDFERISVTCDSRFVSTTKDPNRSVVPKVEELSAVTVEELRQMAAETRGIFFHEVGHNLFTVPLPTLLTLAWQAGYVYVAAMAPGGTTFLPEGMPTHEEWTAQYGDEEPLWVIDGGVQRAWNVAEDQAMEELLVNESPHLASYLTVLVLRQLLTGPGTATSWPLVAGRSYLPEDARRIARQAWAGSTDPQDIAEVIARYAASSDPVEMMAAVIDLRDLLAADRVNPKGGDNHGHLKPGKAGDSGERLKRRSQAQDAKSGSDPVPGGQGDEPSAGDGEDPTVSVPGTGPAADGEDGAETDQEAAGGEAADGEGEGDASPAPGHGTGRPSPSSRPGTESDPDGQTPDTLREVLQDALDDLADDETVTEDVRSINSAYETDEGALPFYSDDGPLQNESLVAEARSIVDDIIKAFQVANSDNAPQWLSGERQGVLEAVRYRTRQPGDMEFFRRFSETGERGHDIAVSVFLDVSGSMENAVQPLSAAAWACKVACQALEVPCDVTLFDTSAWKLWGPEDVADEVPAIRTHGGTDPTAAFSAVLHTERPEKHHIVLVMTDGIWNDVSALKNYRRANTYLMAFNYSTYYGTEASPDQDAVVTLGCDEAYDIGNLMALPRALESMLTSLV